MRGGEGPGDGEGMSRNFGFFEFLGGIIGWGGLAFGLCAGNGENNVAKLWGEMGVR